MKLVIYSFLSVSIGLVLGRITGFLRELYVANVFGASSTTDVLILVLTTPDFLVNLLVGGALSMALIPEFKCLSKSNAQILYRQVMLALGLVFLFITSILFLFSDSVIYLLAPGSLASMSLEDKHSFAISLFSIPLVVLAGISTAYLHSKERFFIASLGTFIFNILIILSMTLTAYYSENYIIVVVSYVVVLASAIRFGLFHFSTQSVSSESIFSFNLITGELAKRYVQCIFTGGFFFLMPIALRAVSSVYGDKEISFVNYATKLVEFPLGVLITVFSIIFFPKLSKLYSEGECESFNEVSTNLFCFILAISFASALPLFVNAYYYVDLLYGAGSKLDNTDLTVISGYLSLYALTLPLQGLNSLLIAIFSARKQANLPLIASCLAIISFAIIGHIFATTMVEVFIFLFVSFALSTFFLMFAAIKYGIFSLKKLKIKVLKIIFLVTTTYFFLVYYNDLDEYTVLYDGFLYILCMLILLTTTKVLKVKA